MKISYKWLKELVDLTDISYEKLVEDLSLYIVEVDEISHLTYGTNLVTAKVLTCVEHPNSDHLHICTVDTGKEQLQIVCGAPNVKAGQTIILALPGAKLLGGEIKKGVIRGVESNGMICSLQELGLEHKFVPKEYQDGIYYFKEEVPLGINPLEYLGLDDEIIDLGLTPNRMDLLSMYGVSRDVAALYSRDHYFENYQLVEAKRNIKEDLEVSVTSDKCIMYNARVIRNVKIKESPDFIKTRLMASGIRPINNVVDITNYCLMLFGQPLHAFDLDKLGHKILVRDAKDDETTKTLDDIERKLNGNDLVITDGSNICCIAGVMGCANTEVDDQTINIALEAAVFDPLSVRKTSAKIGLRSDSSTRFERGVDLNQTIECLNYAAYLISKYADGEVDEGVITKGITHIEDKLIKLTKKDVDKYLGVDLSIERIIEILENLEFKVEQNNNELNVYVPNRRMDISELADLIEEIARFNGYENLNLTLPRMENEGYLTLEQKRERLIRHTLSTLGLNETVTYALTSMSANDEFPILYNQNNKNVSLLHPMSEEHMVLRRSIVPSLIDVLKYNSSRKITDVSIFELGAIYSEKENKEVEQEKVLGLLLSGKYSGNTWDGGKIKVDFYLAKGLVDRVAEKLGIKFVYTKVNDKFVNIHPGRSAYIKFQNEIVGAIYALHPKFTQTNEIDDTYVVELKLDKILTQKKKIEKFAPIVKKPMVVRDLALLMNKDVQVGELIDLIYKQGKSLITNVEVFDLFYPPLQKDLKSVAVKIYFESEEGLTDQIINEQISRILLSLESKFGAKLR